MNFRFTEHQICWRQDAAVTGTLRSVPPRRGGSHLGCQSVRLPAPNSENFRELGVVGASRVFPRPIQCQLAPHWVWHWLAALWLLFGAAGLFAKDSMFTDFPLYQPATNVLQASMATNPAVPLNAAAATSQAGTNAAAPISTNDMNALDNTYRLAIGDRISFRIEEDEDDPKQLAVTDSGDLEIPYIGRHSAAGKTCKELAQALKVELEKEYYYRATVIIAVDSMTRSRGKVYLVGAVRMPGLPM